MRQAFIRALAKLAEGDSRILLLTGDLGYKVVEPFSEQFPDRFLNVGVAEQNMVGIATGLAEAGFIPFIYSIVTFAALRPYEFIRNGPILHQFPVRIVGVGGGFEYGHAGITHHGLEDIGVMRIQPGITVVVPADHLQTRTVVEKTWNLPKPVFYRLGKDDKTVVPGLDGCFQLGRVQQIREGNDVLLIATGSISHEVAAAAEILGRQGIACTVLIVASFNPAPVEDLVDVIARFKMAFTVEAHYIVGGLGSLVSEIVSERGLNCRIVRCGVKQAANGLSGSQDYLNRQYGLSRESLVETVFSRWLKR
jgi:transketolase